jgi:hypothetical protein
MLHVVKAFIARYGVAAGLCAVTLYVMDRLFDTVCLSVLFLGIPCPACGITRATKLLLTGHIKESMNMHPLLILVIMGMIFSLFIKKILKNYRFFIKLYVIISLLIFVGFYFYRMYIYFPDVEPLVYRKNNILDTFIQIWTEMAGRG